MIARRPEDRTPEERWIGFRTHLIVYVLVNTGLTALNLLRNPDNLWFYWPLFGWGAGIGLHLAIMTRRNHLDRTAAADDETQGD